MFAVGVQSGAQLPFSPPVISEITPVDATTSLMPRCAIVLRPCDCATQHNAHNAQHPNRQSLEGGERSIIEHGKRQLEEVHGGTFLNLVESYMKIRSRLLYSPLYLHQLVTSHVRPLRPRVISSVFERLAWPCARMTRTSGNARARCATNNLAAAMLAKRL